MSNYTRIAAILLSGLVLIVGLALDPRSTLAAYLVAWVGSAPFRSVRSAC